MLSVIITRSYHLYIPYLVKFPEWAITQSTLVPSPTYGKVLIAARRSLSNTLGDARKINRPSNGKILIAARQPLSSAPRNARKINRPSKRFVFGSARLILYTQEYIVGAAVILRRGRDMEEAKAPEHRSFHWRHNGPLANRLGVDAEWNSSGVPREKSGRKSDPPGESFPVTALDR